MIGLIAFAQPLGLAALIAPIAFLIAARERGKAEPRLVGSLEIWRRVAGEREVTSRARKAPLTPRIWLVAFAMALIALALGSPNWTTEAEPRVWRVVLDTGASNSLITNVGSVDEASRFAKAVDAGSIWSRDNFDGGRVLWIGGTLQNGAQEFEECAPGARPSEGFLERAAIGGVPRDWARWDTADCLWLPTSDRGDGPRYGAQPKLDFDAAPGPVQALAGGACLWWDASGELVEMPMPGDLPGASVRLVGDGLAAGTVLGDFAMLWTGSRGLDVLRGEGESDVLVIRSLGSGANNPATDDQALRTASIGRDGWRATGTWREGSGATPVGETWLQHRDQVLVAWRPGHIDLTFASLEQLSGDPAAFAVSWATLFERAALPGPGIVSVAERRPAVLLEKRAGEADRAGKVSASKDTPLSPALAILAACLLFGITYRGGRSRV